MRKILYSCMVLLLAFGACYGPTKPGAGMYFFSPVADGDTTQKDSLLTLASYLELRGDGSYSQDFGSYDYGTWMLKDNRLYLTNQHHRTFIYLVTMLTPKELDMTLASGRNGHFRAHVMPSDNPKKDPFSNYNNQWHIPAAHKENDAGIRSRLVNHCQFWEAYFTWVKDRDEGAVDVSLFPTPLKIYGNGFGLKHYSDLPQEWRSCFYDTADCHKADTMIKHTFRRHDFVWPKTDDDFKKLISGTQQLQEWLK